MNYLVIIDVVLHNVKVLAYFDGCEPSSQLFLHSVVCSPSGTSRSVVAHLPAVPCETDIVCHQC